MVSLDVASQDALVSWSANHEVLTVAVDCGQLAFKGKGVLRFLGSDRLELVSPSPTVPWEFTLDLKSEASASGHVLKEDPSFIRITVMSESYACELVGPAPGFGLGTQQEARTA
jgi:hypothetical protein